MFSWSNGIFDIMFNKLIARVTGHIQIIFTQNGKVRKEIIHNKKKIINRIEKNVNGIKRIEENIVIYCKIIGNGKGSYGIISAVEANSNFFEIIKLVDGNKYDLTNSKYINPVIMTRTKANKLNLKLYDTFSINFRTVHGQEQTVKLTLVGLTKGDNFFLSSEIYINIDNIRRECGFSENETKNLKIILNNPELTKLIAKKIHNSLSPDISVIPINYFNSNYYILSYYTNHELLIDFTDNFKYFKGEFGELTNYETLIVSENFANRFLLDIGSNILLNFTNDKTKVCFSKKLKINGIYKSDLFQDNIFFINENLYFFLWENEYINIEDNEINNIIKGLNFSNNKCYVTEWRMLPLNTKVASFEKRYKILNDDNRKGIIAQVSTMHDFAGNNMDFGYLLYYLTWVCAIILFIFIMIGIINTVRMSIRERTQEIGTVRAIGMQKVDVRKVFLLEYLILSQSASILGVAISFFVMNLLKKINITLEGLIVEIILVDGHLHFVTDFRVLIIIMILFFIIISIGIYIPVKNASNIKPSEALRYYE